MFERYSLPKPNVTVPLNFSVVRLEHDLLVVSPNNRSVLLGLCQWSTLAHLIYTAREKV